MATIQQIEKGVAKFIDQEIAPKIPVNIPNGQLKKIAALAGATYAVKHNLALLAVNPAVSAIGLMDKEGNVDLEGLVDAARTQIPAEGFKMTVPILGDLTFFLEDVERLQNYITEG